jgi:hypothetical protein
MFSTILPITCSRNFHRAFHRLLRRVRELRRECGSTFSCVLLHDLKSVPEDCGPDAHVAGPAGPAIVQADRLRCPRSRRSREIGIRMALGTRSPQVVWTLSRKSPYSSVSVLPWVCSCHWRRSCSWGLFLHRPLASRYTARPLIRWRSSRSQPSWRRLD